MDQLGGDVRGTELDDGDVRPSAFMRRRPYGFVLGVMTCAAAIVISGAVAAATHDENKSVLGTVAPSRPTPEIAIGPIEWAPKPVRVSEPPKPTTTNPTIAVAKPVKLKPTKLQPVHRVQASLR